MKYFRRLPLAMAITVSISNTYAQDNEDDLNGLFLEEVIVTAQHREETLQDAAIPISVATGEELGRLGVTNVGGLNNISPSLQVNRSGGANVSYFVRGVGNFTSNSYTDPAVAFNLDGVYLGRPSSSTASFLDVERIEVLKGPQGTLYGRNATGGAINVIPVKPVLGENLGSLTLSFGNYDAIEMNGTANVAMGESTAVRVAATIIEDDGYNDDGTGQTDDIAVRTQIFSELSDTVDLRLSLDYAEVKGTGTAAILEGNYAFQGPFQGGVRFEGGEVLSRAVYVPAPANVSDPYGGYYTDAAQDYITGPEGAPILVDRGNGVIVPSQALFAAGLGRLIQDGNQYPRSDNSNFGITGELNIETSIGDLVIIPAYRKSEIDDSGLGAGFKALLSDETAEQTSLEMRLSGSAGDLDWLVGAYYFDEEVDANYSVNQHWLNSVQEYETGTEALALFLRGTWNLSDSFRIVGGVRINEDEKSFDGQANTFIVSCTLPDPTAPCLNTPALPAELDATSTIAAIDEAGLFTAVQPTLAPNGGFAPVPYGTEAVVFNAVTEVRPPVSPKDWSEVTYRLAFEFDITADSLLYAGYETGYRSGGYNLALGKETYEPEFLDAFTLGSKNRFMNNRLQLNAEAFYWKYEDQQVAHAGLDLVGNNAFYTENIGESTIYGLDVDLLFQAAQNTLISASFQYLKNELDDFTYIEGDAAGNADPFLQGEITPIIGCDATPGEVTLISGATRRVFSIDCSGEEGFQSPEISANLGIQQGLALTDDLELVGNLDVRYRDSFWAGTAYLPESRQEAATKVDVSLTLAPTGSDAWFVSLWGRNVTDEATANNRFFFVNSGNSVTTTYAPPATYGVRGGVKF